MNCNAKPNKSLLFNFVSKPKAKPWVSISFDDELLLSPIVVILTEPSLQNDQFLGIKSGTEIFDATITASGSVYSATGAAPTSFSATQIQEPILRLPAGVHKVYQIEVTSANPVHEICIGESIDELRAI